MTLHARYTRRQPLSAAAAPEGSGSHAVTDENAGLLSLIPEELLKRGKGFRDTGSVSRERCKQRRQRADRDAAGIWAMPYLRVIIWYSSASGAKRGLVGSRARAFSM